MMKTAPGKFPEDGFYLFYKDFSFSLRNPCFFITLSSDDEEGISVRTELVVLLESCLVRLHDVLISTESGY